MFQQLAHRSFICQILASLDHEVTTATWHLRAGCHAQGMFCLFVVFVSWFSLLILRDLLFLTWYSLSDDQRVTWLALSLTLARCKRFVREVESFVTHYLPEPHDSVAIGCQTNSTRFVGFRRMASAAFFLDPFALDLLVFDCNFISL